MQSSKKYDANFGAGAADHVQNVLANKLYDIYISAQVNIPIAKRQNDIIDFLVQVQDEDRTLDREKKGKQSTEEDKAKKITDKGKRA